MLIKCTVCNKSFDNSTTFGKSVCIDCQDENIELNVYEKCKDDGWNNLAKRQREKNHWA